MIKKYFNFLNEYDNIKWCVGIGKHNGLDITDWIGKFEKHQIKNGSINVTFILPYSQKLYNYEDKKNCLVIPEKNIKILNKRKEPNLKNATERLKNIIDIDIFNGDNIDYLDIGTEMGYVSYLSKNKMNELENEDPYNNRFRQQTTIGKLIYKHSIFYSIKKTSIEIITNIYKSITKNIYNENDIKIVKGEKIRYWYNEDNYLKGGGQLNKSCMKYKEKQYLLDLFVENTDVCRLLILKDKETNKLKGRALLWKTNKGIYMDRIYTVNDYDMYVFKGTSEKNKWLSYDNDINKRLTVQLRKDKIYKPENSPFMDTFKYYFKEEKELCNFRPYGDYDVFIY